MITRAQVDAITGDAETWLRPLTSAIAGFDISTDLRIKHFLAQCAHESGGFKRLTEDLRYSATRLYQVFPKHFTKQEVASFAFDEERIAERLYGGRLGNYPEGEGDGYRFRGRGLIQITGRANYRAASRGVNLVDFEVKPEIVCEPLYAALTAAWFWSAHGCNEFADLDDIESITRAINGGLTGLDDRMARLESIEKALA